MSRQLTYEALVMVLIRVNVNAKIIDHYCLISLALTLKHPRWSATLSEMSYCLTIFRG